MSSKLHPDSKLKINDITCNESNNPSMMEIIEQRKISRREFLKSSVTATAGITTMTFLGTAAMESMASFAEDVSKHSPLLGFNPVSPNLQPMIDGITVPDGYTARVLISWGDSINDKPDWDTVSAMDEETQLHCYGAHTDGMHFSLGQDKLETSADY